MTYRDRHEQKPDQRTPRGADNEAEATPALNHTAIIRNRARPHGLATLTVTHNIGVRIQDTYVIKRIDEDFLDEE